MILQVPLQYATGEDFAISHELEAPVRDLLLAVTVQIAQRDVSMIPTERSHSIDTLIDPVLRSLLLNVGNVLEQDVIGLTLVAFLAFDLRLLAEFVNQEAVNTVLHRLYAPLRVRVVAKKHEDVVFLGLMRSLMAKNELCLLNSHVESLANTATSE